MKRSAQISRSRQQILALSKKTYQHLGQMLKAKGITKGSIYIQKKKCGNPNCKCAKGDLHRSKILSMSHQGKTRLIPLTKYTITEFVKINRQVKNYQSFRYNRAQIVHCFKLLIAEINKLEMNLLIEVPKKGEFDGGQEKEIGGGTNNK